MVVYIDEQLPSHDYMVILTYKSQQFLQYSGCKIWVESILKHCTVQKFNQLS